MIIEKKDTKEEMDLWCHYSDLPSPSAYVTCMDYDSMGNHGRFPKKKEQEIDSINKVKSKISQIFSNGKSK